MSPYAPHLAEEVWSRLGNTGSLAYESWPVHDESLLVRDTISLPVQVNGKMRGTVEISKDATQDDALSAAASILGKYSEGKAPKKIVYVGGKILNVVYGK